MHIATKVGLTNNGYIPYNDYTRDYSPPNSMRTGLKNHLTGHSPLINSTQNVNGGIDSYTLGRGNRELRQDNGLPTIPLNTMPNGIISKYYTLNHIKDKSKRSCCCHDNNNQKYRDNFLTQTTSILDQSLLNNVDIRYSATYGNPYLKNSSISPLPPPITHKPFTANPTVTPQPPPYTKSRGSNSNSSFSSSTTISNSGSLLGGANNNNNSNSNINNNSVGLSYPNSSSNISTGATVTSTTANTQIISPSRQFILPANGDLKKGSLATHV